jgi:hypothetical protein
LFKNEQKKDTAHLYEHIKEYYKTDLAKQPGFKDIKEEEREDYIQRTQSAPGTTTPFYPFNNEAQTSYAALKKKIPQTTQTSPQKRCSRLEKMEETTSISSYISQEF